LNNEHIVKIGLTFFWFSAPALLVVSVIFFVHRHRRIGKECECSINNFGLGA